MRPGRITILFVVIAMFFTMNLSAGNSLMASQERNSERMNQQDSESHLSRLAKDLSLSKEQTAELKMIFDEHSEEMQTIHQSGSRDRSEMEEMHKKLDAKIMKILDEDQQKKFLELQKNRPDGPRDRK